MVNPLNWLADLWVRSCKHDDRDVLADLHEFDFNNERDRWTRVLYCTRCGSYRIVHGEHPALNEWQRPRPLWSHVGGKP